MTNSDIAASMLTVAATPTRSMRFRRLAMLARRHATPEHAFIAGSAIYVLLSALAFFVVRPQTLLYFADYWEHRAIVAEIARHGTHVVDPIYGEHASSRQYTPWSFALGYLARVGRLDIDTVMAWGAMVVSLLFLAGVHGFARAYYRHRWAPALLLAALTCAWGLPPLIWTGFYSLRSQLHGNYYPASLVFALSFFAWGSVLRLLRNKHFGAIEGFLLWAATACSVITHPLNAVFLVAGAGAFILFESGVASTRRAGVALVVATGIGATVFWPYFNPLSLAGAGLARGQATFNNFSFFFNPLFVIALGWPAIFGLLGLPGLIRTRNMLMPLVALGSTFSAYVIGGIADISVSHRLLAYVFLWLHLLLVKAALDVIGGQPPRLMDTLTPRAWRWVYAGSALLVAWQVGMGVQQLIYPWADTHYPYPVHPVEAEVSRVTAVLPAGARILGWDSAALVMPSHNVLVAEFPRPMPLSASDSARQADYRRFFTPGTSRCARLAIARRWHVTHIAYLAHELDDRVQRELGAIEPAISPVYPWRIIPVPVTGATSC